MLYLGRIVGNFQGNINTRRPAAKNEHFLTAHLHRVPVAMGM